MRFGFDAIALCGLVLVGAAVEPAMAAPRVNSGSSYFYPQVPSRTQVAPALPQPVIRNRVIGVPPSFGPTRIHGPQYGTGYGGPPTNRVWGNPQNEICRTCSPGERFPGIPYYRR